MKKYKTWAVVDNEAYENLLGLSEELDVSVGDAVLEIVFNHSPDSKEKETFVQEGNLVVPVSIDEEDMYDVRLMACEYGLKVSKYLSLTIPSFFKSCS